MRSHAADFAREGTWLRQTDGPIALASAPWQVLKQRDDCACTDALPRLTKHQGPKLLGIQLDFGAVSHTRSEEASLIQTPGGKPNPHAVMHQHFHAIGAAVGEQIGSAGFTAPNTTTTRASAV